MEPDRGARANFDRRLMAGLGRDERFQMVRVPVSPAKWSTWKRYCAATGISMGRAIIALIDRELASVAETSVDDSPVLAQLAREQLASREAELGVRERDIEAVEERYHSRSEQLRRWEAELQTLAQRVEHLVPAIAICRTDSLEVLVEETGRLAAQGGQNPIPTIHDHDSSNPWAALRHGLPRKVIVFESTNPNAACRRRTHGSSLR